MQAYRQAYVRGWGGVGCVIHTKTRGGDAISFFFRCVSVVSLCWDGEEEWCSFADTGY